MPENLLKSKNKPKNKRFRTVNLEERSFSELSFICDRLSSRKSVFLKNLISQLFDVFSEYKKGSCNMFYDSVRGKIIITVTGNSYIECGMRGVEPEIAEIEKNAEPIISKFPAKVKNDG